jgi:hypothetical protein
MVRLRSVFVVSPLRTVLSNPPCRALNTGIKRLNYSILSGVRQPVKAPEDRRREAVSFWVLTGSFLSRKSKEQIDKAMAAHAGA